MDYKERFRTKLNLMTSNGKSALVIVDTILKMPEVAKSVLGREVEVEQARKLTNKNHDRIWVLFVYKNGEAEAIETKFKSVGDVIPELAEAYAFSMLDIGFKFLIEYAETGFEHDHMAEALTITNERLNKNG